MNMVIESKENGLFFRRFPRPSSFDEILIILKDVDETNRGQAVICRNGNRRLRLNRLPDGVYTLEVYFKTNDMWYGFIGSHDIKLVIRHGVPSFVEPWCLGENESIMRRLKTSHDTMRKLLRSTSQYPCDNPMIRELASTLSSGLNNDYGKLLAVHDWVAENIYYDYDSFHSPSRWSSTGSTLTALISRRAVCQGYSDIAVSILRAMRIPACSIACFALGETTSGGWEKRGNRVADPNHAFTMAYVGGRYVFMDVTWDSDNIYFGGRFGHKTGSGKLRKYFDASLTLLSATHRLVIQ